MTERTRAERDMARIERAIEDIESLTAAIKAALSESRPDYAEASSAWFLLNQSVAELHTGIMDAWEARDVAEAGGVDEARELWLSDMRERLAGCRREA